MKFVLDLDGTILDSRERLYRLFCALAPATALSFHDYWKLKSVPASNRSILQTHFHWSESSTGDFERQWTHLIEDQAYLGFDKPFDTTIKALRILQRRGELYLLTSRQYRDRVIAQLRAHALDGYFDAVIVTGPDRNKKQALQSELVDDLDASYALIGDTEVDIQTARHFGIRAIAVHSGVRAEAFLRSFEPDAIYPDLFAFSERESTAASWATLNDNLGDR